MIMLNPVAGLLIGEYRRFEIFHFLGVPCFSEPGIDQIFFMQGVYINDAHLAGMRLQTHQDISHYAAHDRSIKGIEEKDAVYIAWYLKIKSVVVDNGRVDTGNCFFCKRKILFGSITKFFREVDTR